MTEPEMLEGGRLNPGRVMRIGDRVHRPRGKGAGAAEALLLHLESVGFDAAPRFLGHDDEGRQVLSYVEGTVYSQARPRWIDDDQANALMIGRIAALVRDLHDAVEGFEPPPGTDTFRPLPVPGTTWNHGDVHYANTAFRDDVPVAFIDFDCCARADRMYDPASLLLCSCNPRPGHPDNPRRERAAMLTVDAVLEGYGAGDDEQARFASAVAAVFDDVADFMLEKGADTFADGDPEELARQVDRTRWQADWWRNHTPV